MSASAPAAREQVARLLTLVPFLHAHGGVRLEDASAALGISAEQLLKDLKVLFMCGLPGGYPDDLIDVDLDALEGEKGDPRPDAVIRVSNADYLTRPLRLTPTEASAIIVALRALSNGARPDTVEIVDRVLAKLEAAAAEGPSQTQVDPGHDPGTTDQLELAAQLKGAADSGHQVRLTYHVPSRDEVSERVVDPRGVVTAQGFAYLDAYCHSAEAPRLFRLDRVAHAETLSTKVETEPQAPRDLGEGLFVQADDTTLTTLRLRPEARWVVEYYPVEDERPQPDGSVEVDLLVADQRWLIRLLLRLTPHVEVVSPGAYAAVYVSAARATLALYDGPRRTM